MFYYFNLVLLIMLGTYKYKPESFESVSIVFAFFLMAIVLFKFSDYIYNQFTGGW